MTSLKRKRDAEEQAIAVTSNERDTLSQLLYDPSAPLYAFDFIDKLVSQYASGSVSASSSGTEDIVCCPRAYEESFLREAINSERQCVNGDRCEGMRIPCASPFILREFHYPGQAPPEQRSMCLMCRRMEVSRLFFAFESGTRNICPGVRVSSHYNIVGVPGEYCLRDVIVSSGKYTGLCMPVVLHMRSAYEQEVVDGVRWYRQAHLGDPANADDANSCAFLSRGAILRSRERIARSNPGSPVRLS